MAPRTVHDGAVLREPTPALNRLAELAIGAAIEVHRTLGPGLLESAYEQAMCVELTLRKIPFTRQQNVELRYKGHRIGRGRFDLLIGDELIVEIKAVEALHEVHVAQVLTYLKTTGRLLALLINFNVPVLRNGIKRVIRS